MSFANIPVRSMAIWCLCFWASLGLTVSPPSSLRDLKLPNPHFQLGNPNSLVVPTPGNSNEPGSFGIDFYPSNTSVKAQAVAGILTQALYEAYVKDGFWPKESRPLYDFPYVENSIVPPLFSVRIQMAAVGNQTGDYVLTNQRVVLVLSLMGFSFAHEKDLMNLKEYAFDVVVARGDKPQVVIARGSLTNIDSPPSKIS